MTGVDVCVIGAGFAGLTAARRLQAAGCSVALLEARDRVGGRTQTIEVAGVALDIGGMWVGSGQDLLYALAREFGVKTTRQLMVGETVVLLDGAAHRGGFATALSPPALASLGEALGALETLARSVPATAPWEAPDAAALDAMTLAAWLDARLPDPGARAFLETVVGSVFAADSANLSVLAVGAYAAAAGGWNRLTRVDEGAQQDRFVGGVQQIAVALAAQLGPALRTGFAVHRVTASDGVVVEGSAGVVNARRTIVALPPTLAGRLVYDPPLPARRDQLFQQLPAGSVIKFHVVYERPFWRSGGLSGQVLAPGEPVGVTFDTSPPGHGVITGFFEGRHAVEFGMRTEAERREAVLGILRRALGGEAEEPLAYVDRDWSAEPFTRGCYGAHFPPGVLTRFGPALREPCGPIHWAGTETARRWTGYIEGAIESGERAAEEVLSVLA